MKLARDITGEDLVALGFVKSEYGYDRGLVRVECGFELDGLLGVRAYAFIGRLDGLISWTVVFVGPIPATAVLASLVILSGEAS